MSTDTTRRRTTVIVPERRLTSQLLAAAARDTDAVSIFSNGTSWADSDVAIFVVKGAENIAFMRALCERQGLLTPGKAVEG